MKSAITLAQVPEAKAGPFVFHQPLSEGFAKAAELGATPIATIVDYNTAGVAPKELFFAPAVGI